MVDYRTVPVKDLGKGSNIKVDLCEAEVDLYWKMAIEVIELIEENNKKGEPTVMIVPYGPLGPYARLVYLVNKYRISLKNCWFINMDEYLDDNLQYLDKSDPLSFRGGMDRIFYNLVDEELNVPEAQRIFPAPGKEDEIWALIQKFGSPDYRALTPEMRKTFNQVISLDLTDRLPLVKAETLLFWGEDDTETPLWMGRKMEELIPDAALIAESGTGHFAYLERAEKFNRIILSFLTEGR